MSASGITPRLIIDGQQRVTTATLLVVALARYARSHPDEELPFTFEEIIEGGYVINKWKKGEDHYRLTLSQGDRDVLRAIEDNLENPDSALPDGSSRLEENLAFFEERLEGLSDVSLAWSGLHRLEVVSISLTQGQDNPQLIFESMNSTGKDLASADLIRNFCLMSYPAAEQDDLYHTYWRPIEEALGTSTYDQVFDTFVRCWLTIVKAPDTPTNRDIYQLFKRHVVDNGLGEPEEMKGLLLELRRFAKYYANVTQGTENDDELRKALADVATLDISVANVLLVSFYDDYEANAFGKDDFVAMVRIVESYLFRRMVCDAPSNGLNKFFPSLVARLNKVQTGGDNYLEALSAMLMGEAGTARRFPDDREFTAALRTRNSYGFRKSLFLLSKLENSYHPGAARDFSQGNYTIEHIMPQAALKSAEWLNFLGDNPEEAFEEHVNTLGNLTLTAYNSELSNGSFAQKRKRAIAGYDNDFITISQSLKETETWTPRQIEERGANLARLAATIWRAPSVDASVIEAYKADKSKKKPKGSTVSWANVFASGKAPAGTTLYSTSQLAPGTAIVTGDGKIRLETGEECTSPTAAFVANMRANGGKASARNGWLCWRIGSPDGALLDTLRDDLKTREVKRSELWLDFYGSCDEDTSFTQVFGETDGRTIENYDNWTTWGIGYGFCKLLIRLLIKNGVLRVGLEYRGPGMEEAFEKLADAQSQVEGMLSPVAADAKVEWDEKKQSRKFLWLRREVDFEANDMSDIWSWLRQSLLALRSAAKAVYK